MPLGHDVAKGRWSDGLPVASVPMGSSKRVTLIYPYYACPQFFARQLALWRTYPADVQTHVRAVVVDDGSPEPVVVPLDRPLGLRVFRLEVDVPWNWLAARNIGAHHADDGWLLLTDMDHVVPAETITSIVCGTHSPSAVYAFSRREHTGQSLHPHSASFLMTKALFWSIGGYDERLSGVYGTDGAFRKRVAASAPIHVLPDVLVRHEYVSDSSVTTYDRKTPEMRARRQRMFAACHGQAPPRVLSFPYHEVLS